MLPPDAFEPAPRQTRGDTNEDVIYAAVGRALSRWETFEGENAELFGAVLGTYSTGPALRAYGSVVAFSGRQDMIIAASDSFFWKRSYVDEVPDNGLQPELVAFVRKICGKASARRNEIAHGVVMGKETRFDYPGFFLYPARYTSRKRDTHHVPSYSFTAKIIDDYSSHFVTLGEMAKSLRERTRQLT